MLARFLEASLLFPSYFSRRQRAPRTDASASVQFRPWCECIAFKLGARERVKLLFPRCFDRFRGVLKNRRIIVTMDLLCCVMLRYIENASFDGRKIVRRLQAE